MKAIIYCRKSSEGEDRQALSLEAQLNEARRIARRDGIDVARVFSESKSAKVPQDRPMFAEMMAMLYRGEADTIVTWKLDRLARNPVDGGALNWALQQGHIKRIVTPDRSYLPEDNVLMMMLEFGMANQYIIDLRKNVLRGMRLKAEKGGWNHRAPFGYRNALGKVEEDPDRARWVQRIFEMRVMGNGYGEIADELNRLSVGSPRGGDWRSSVVEKALKNRFYIGAVRFQGEFFDGAHRPIIGKSLWASAQAVGRRMQGKRSHAFRGMLTCGECGCAVTSQTTKGHNYYHCTKKKGPCSQKGTREETLSKAFLSLLDRNTRPEIFAEIRRAWADSDLVDFAVREKAVESINRRIASLERERAGNGMMRRNEEIDGETYRKVEKGLADKVLALEVERGKMARLDRENVERGVASLKLMERLSLSLKVASPEVLSSFLKRVGSNFTLTNRKPQPKAVNDGLGLLFFGENMEWSPMRVQAKTVFMRIMDNLEALEGFWKMLRMRIEMT